MKFKITQDNGHKGKITKKNEKFNFVVFFHQKNSFNSLSNKGSFVYAFPFFNDVDPVVVRLPKNCEKTDHSQFIQISNQAIN